MTTDLRAALTTLADRYDEMADRLTAGHPTTLLGHFTVTQQRQAERAHVLRRTAADIRELLVTGRIPHDLMTDAELDQHGTPTAS
ncbi:hypothetical protein [Streptomyces sp. PD-S100-1]|uniref:hypothetical protein n=1 Tax=Streptomyces sp. PD-S100-1 TaxID=3394351 RepID=UPI0039BCA6FF